MTNRKSDPLISVLMPSYNHERFIEAAITSVLAQTFNKIELIIVDDGSLDASPSIISAVKDPRVRYRILEKNQGACDAMNIALQMSRGKLIAVCNSDDKWYPDKLARQLRTLEKLPKVAAIFSNVEWIDDNGKNLSILNLPPFAGVFKQRNRSRWTWLRDLLETGNCLCHPSILIRRETYDAAGLYDNRLRQIPDLDMWLRVFQHFDIFVMPDKLVDFRIHDSNTSTPRSDVSRRSINEHRLILHKMMKDISKENFMKAFGFKAISVNDELDFQIEQALYLLSSKSLHDGMFRELGLDILFKIMGEPEGLARLSAKYEFSIADFHREMAVFSPWTPGAATSNNAVLGDTIKLLRTMDLIRIVISRITRRALMVMAGPRGTSKLKDDGLSNT